MALGDKIDCPVGGVVEATFQLDLKQASVSALPDGVNFRFCNFQLVQRAKAIVSTDDRRVKPNSVEVKGDDQKITVRWSFTNFRSQEGKDTFVAGDEWQLQMGYAPNATGMPPEGERLFTLGTVRMSAPK